MKRLFAILLLVLTVAFCFTGCSVEEGERSVNSSEFIYIKDYDSNNVFFEVYHKDTFIIYYEYAGMYRYSFTPKVTITPEGYAAYVKYDPVTKTQIPVPILTTTN